ncbi:MAG: HTTM domain-containing protein [Mariniblastus sp.]
MAIFKKMLAGWNHFFHREEDLSILAVIRIGFGILLLINVVSWWPDLEKWFGENGVMTLDVSRQVIDSDTYTIFQWLPTTTFVLWTCYLLLITNLVCLIFGFLTRVQLVCIFVLFTSFCHRNIVIFDGEDTLFRLMAFYLLFSPAGKYFSIDNWIARKRSGEPSAPRKFAIWPIRLIQIQTAAIVFFSGIEKLQGVEWRDGTAIYYVSRLDDFFYRFPLPDFLFTSLTMIAIATWSALVVELTVPILVWFRKLRIFALIIMILFHLSLEYMMNLNMFQWIMIVGWLSFLVKRGEAIGNQQAAVVSSVRTL